MTIRNFFRPLLTGRMAAVLAGSFMTLLCFDILWCAQTTFRALSIPALWSILVLASLVLSFPYATLRRLWVQVTIWLAADAFLTANLMYARTYFASIPLSSYAIAGNLRDFLPSVADSFRAVYLLLPVVTLLASVAAWMTGVRRPHQTYSDTPVYGRRKRRPSPIVPWLVCVLASLAVSWGLVAMRGGFMKFYDSLRQACYYSTCTTPVFTPAGDLWYQFRSGTDTMTPADSMMLDRWRSQHRAMLPLLPLDSAAAGGRDTRRDCMVVILCESLESWPLEAEADGVELTPYLNSLIADSTTLYAPLTVTQVASGRSIDCQLMLNAGLLPMQDGVYSMSYPSNVYPSLPRAMAEMRGARSLLLTPDSPTTWNQALAARSFGIDTLMARDSWRLDETAGNPPKLSDGSFLRQVSERLSDPDIWPVGSPRFIEILTYSGHNPFRLPEALRTVSFSERYPEQLRDYMTTAHYTDAALSTLVETIRRRPDFDRTIVVITGDHEGLASSRDELRASSPADSLVSPGQFTPFIVLNSPVAGRIDRPVGQVDLYPTLLQLMGLTDYGWHGVGASILSPAHPGVAIATMTGETAGDVSSVSPEMMQHLRDARAVSDRIIRFRSNTL